MERESSLMNSSMVISKDDMDDGFCEEEKPLSSEEIKSEFEKLKKSVDMSMKGSENCLLLRKLYLVHKFNESNSNCFDNSIFTDVSNLASHSIFSAPLSILSNDSGDKNSGNDGSSPTNLNRRRHNSDKNKHKKNYIILEGEEIKHHIEEAYFIHKFNKIIEGEFIVTNYKIIFNPKNPDFCVEHFILPDFFQVPYTYISSVTKKKDTALGNGKMKYILRFHIRDRPNLQIQFSNKNKKEWGEFSNYVTEMITPKNISSYFAFKYFQKYENSDNNEYENGWNKYQNLLEFARMGLNTEDENAKYRLYIQEIHGSLCETYPNFIYIHSKISNEEIFKVANFRSKKRFPALVWFSKLNQSSLWRSSQARTGLINQRSCADELFFNNLSHETEKLHIYDARPYLNAFANKMKGLGFENPENYKNAQLTFCDIDNIHVVKQAYTKENATVLIHCSDGWDRTAQLSGLSQLIIDPYYRTLNGFQVLIEKEWISYGHQFALRCGHNIAKDEENVSPIFIQWLDCVYQLLVQFPDLFEFNVEMLVFIAFHVNSCLYGTFLMNCEKDRMKGYLKFKTVSIWTDVNSNRLKFLNTSYDEYKSNKTILTPSCALYKLKLWEEHFLRWNPHYVMNNFNNLSSPYV